MVKTDHQYSTNTSPLLPLLSCLDTLISISPFLQNDTLAKNLFGTPIQTRFSGDGTAEKQNAPGCQNQIHTSNTREDLIGDCPLRGREYLLLIASKNRIGRLRRTVKRAFILSGGLPLTIGDILPRAYPRLKHYPCGYRSSLRRALLRECQIIARNLRGCGRPNL